MLDAFDGPDQGILAALLATQAAAANKPIAALADADRNLARLIASLDPLKAISTFGGLLTRPALHANCLRLEALVHLAALLARGARKPNREAVSQAFQALGPHLGFMADPAEDLFVSLVPTCRGNFRVFEGISEGAAFYVHRFVEIIEAMPRRAQFDGMHDSVYALLALSEAVASRARVRTNDAGAEYPLRHLPASALGSLSTDRGAVTFTH
jgi:hypothetical protein